MTFSDSEINLNAALFSNVFFTEFFSFIHSTTNNIEQREHDHNRAEKKNKIKEESKKKSTKPKNVQNKNHPHFSSMQLHTIFNMKMQCNVFLPHVLLTCHQFQRLKYSACPMCLY